MNLSEINDTASGDQDRHHTSDCEQAHESNRTCHLQEQTSKSAKLLASAFALDQNNHKQQDLASPRNDHLFTTTVDNTNMIASVSSGKDEQGILSKNEASYDDDKQRLIRGTDQEKLTSDLIRKQLMEIEKDISRRMQNKNVKKMDEQEMRQLLLDRCLAGAGDQIAMSSLIDEPVGDLWKFNKLNVSETLDQIRHQQYQQSNAHNQNTQQMPSNDYASTFSPQSFTAALQSLQMNIGSLHPQNQSISPGVGSADYNANQLPMPSMAQMLPPNLSAITPETTAILLAQLLQRQNPVLDSGILTQQQSSPLSNYQPATSNIIAQSILQNDLNAPFNTTQESTHVAKINNFVVSDHKKRIYQQKRRASISGGSASFDSICPINPSEILKNDDDHCDIIHRQNSTEMTNTKDRSTNPSLFPSDQPIWVMRESYLKRRERDEKFREPVFPDHPFSDKTKIEDTIKDLQCDDNGETDRLLTNESVLHQKSSDYKHEVEAIEESVDSSNGLSSRKGSKKDVIIHEPAVLIEGVLFRARYLGSTQMSSDGRTTKSSRMAQAQEAVTRVKAPEGEPQPSTEIDLFISTEKIMVLNTDLQRISETDVRQDILMDHSLRSISYIADIGDLVVLMARRMPCQQDQTENIEIIRKAPRVVCHVFESEEANFIAQSIGQAFQVAYTEFLRANGIEDPNYLRDIDYQEVLNSQEMMAEELELLARKETQKDVIISKRAGEPLGIVIVESGWGSMLPTSVVANMAPGGAAARSNQLNIGDQVIGVNGISFVGLPLNAAQQNIKNTRSSTAVRMTIVSTPPVVEVRIRRPDTKYQLGFSVQNGVICSLLRGGIAERGGIRVGHRIIEINQLSVVAVPHERIVNMLATATGEIHMKTMPTSMFRLLTGQEIPNYI